MATIEELEERLNTFEETLIQLSRDMVPVVGKVDHTANEVKAITPYTETKTGYYGEREKTFYDVPMGNITVSFDNYNGDYSVGRIADRVTVSFDALSAETQITISVL